MTATLERGEAPAAPVAPQTRFDISRYLVTIPLAIVVFFAGYPLVRVLAQATRTSTGSWGTETITTTLVSSSFREALRNTVTITVAATVGCLLLGTLVATLIAFAPFRGSGLASKLIDVIVAMPSFLVVLAFVFLYGRSGAAHAILGDSVDFSTFLSSPVGVVAAEVTFFTPFVIRPLLAAYSQLPPAQLNVAASLGASPLRVFAIVLFPEIVPALAASGGLTVLLTLNEFGIVAFTGAKGVRTIPTQIYTTGIVTADVPAAAVYACVQIILSLVLFGGLRLLARRLAGRRGGRV
ncbi:2-aminoethylphosphonate ABC transporter permease subunit [Mycobacterium spongiae]|uniref:2-aminoethylphosphonate ABC transporter permease subunit n=1 Tax=Mycobacterium spongiae TaxID=886343 RepID=A0A975JYK8_9MYCO|nr:2-aminoethylphosphonate ABC transporter permease subunit [Mycobacterium spongiae]QUR68077.1 2-aminoethylphosphonate ABC transporter permease subunit [Mycobacterium spongiae]